VHAADAPSPIDGTLTVFFPRTDDPALFWNVDAGSHFGAGILGRTVMHAILTAREFIMRVSSFP
jgi:hypothetical protein